MTGLTQDEYEKILHEYLCRSGQVHLLEVDSARQSLSSKFTRSALLLQLRKSLLWHLARLEAKLTKVGKRGHWIPDSNTPVLSISETECPSNVELNIAVHMHVYFLDVLPELLFHTQNIGQNFTCYVTTDTCDKASAIEILLKKHPFIKSRKIIVVPNKGRDIAPWVIEMAPYNNHHDLWCHIHTKKSPHIPLVGEHWRHFLFDHLLGDQNSVQQILLTFAKEADLGIVIPPFYAKVFNRHTTKWGDLHQAEHFFESLDMTSPPPRRPIFSAGSMSWYRPKALSRLFHNGLIYDDFEEEDGQLGGTKAHMIERSLVYITLDSGMQYKMITR